MSEIKYLHKFGDPPDRFHVHTDELAKRPDMFPFEPEAPHDSISGEKEPEAPKPVYWAKHIGFGEFDIFMGDDPKPVEHAKGKDVVNARVSELNGAPIDDSEGLVD
jgi:hypothetical protein